MQVGTWNSCIKQSEVFSHIGMENWVLSSQILGAKIRPLQSLKSRVKKLKKKVYYVFLHHFYIVTKYVWKTCVDLGSKPHCSAQQSKTLASDELFLRGLCEEKRKGRYVMSASCKGGLWVICFCLFVLKKVLLYQHMGQVAYSTINAYVNSLTHWSSHKQAYILQQSSGWDIA